MAMTYGSAMTPPCMDAGESTEVQAPMASSDEESKQLQESTVRNQETKEKDSAAQESDDCIQNNTVDHVAPQVCIIANPSLRPATEGAR